ncbi:MAG: hypothetical protein KAJ19_25240 [Gammaproteobacteria bacterium]|nr:hypothetical protein [Gammaproteobacteria bacterium]
MKKLARMGQIRNPVFDASQQRDAGCQGFSGVKEAPLVRKTGFLGPLLKSLKRRWGGRR